jgi:hypothetical protein
MDAARLLIRFVLQVSSLPLRHDTVRFRAFLDAIQVYLPRSEAARLAHRELAVLNAVHDPLLLLLLARVAVTTGASRWR